MRGAAIASLHREVRQSFPNKGPSGRDLRKGRREPQDFLGRALQAQGTDSKFSEEASELKWREQGGKWPVMSSEGGGRGDQVGSSVAVKDTTSAPSAVGAIGKVDRTCEITHYPGRS